MSGPSPANGARPVDGSSAAGGTDTSPAATRSRLRRVAANERIARRVGFGWGLAEGVAFFIVPDVYICFATLFSLRAGAVAWIASIAGSVVAVLLVFLLHAADWGPGYLAFLEAMPGISPGLTERVGESLAAAGLPYTPLLVTGGVPLKVYAAQAFALGTSLVAVLAWTLFARVVRIAPSYAIAAGARLLFRRRVDARPVVWIVLLVAAWAAFYVFYFLRMAGA